MFIVDELDLYSVLGVLPTADPVVIKAAYRALAQIYHPDKWSGNSSEAHARMATLNAAFKILGDASLRADYDARQVRQKTASYRHVNEASEFEDAFDAAMTSNEQRWQIACEVFPDLEKLKDTLGLISNRLAFSFVIFMLEAKKFKLRHEVAQELEREFLERFFGTNRAILAYARYLIMTTRRDAALFLNQLVDVLGSDVDADSLILKVRNKFELEPYFEDVTVLIHRYLDGKRLAPGEVRALAMHSIKDPSIANLSERYRGETLLHQCARLSLKESAVILLKAGADPDAIDGSGQRPYQLAASELMRDFLQKKV